ncbi:MAG: type I-F CRISPR-associated protein Csy3 [Proteobacteria bacterium]|nr:type I-F CRISPR-associated protein Csy3 [Pseudomonadota bacterium]
MAKSGLKNASVLAFERKLDPSDALFSAGLWNNWEHGDDWPSIGVREKIVRGTKLHRFDGKKDPAKLQSDITSPNLQTVDVASLPSDMDTLRVRFTLRVLGEVGRPSACNNADYQMKLSGVVDRYIGEHGFGELARRYACNLANGRFLWRNRVGAEAVEVRVSWLRGGNPKKQWPFNALEFQLRNFDAPPKDQASLDELASVIESGLGGKDHVLLEVTAYARMGDGQEVYPSQELVIKQSNKKGEKSKTLYTVGDVAGMHSQKIGNALRTIDTWYQSDENLGPIAVEPYGAVTTQGKAYRQPKAKTDFYSLLDNWILRDKAPDKDQQHFVMATVIRGGVFGESEKD